MMAFRPGKPNAVPPSARFDEWINLLAEISDADKRRLARWLAANGIEAPEYWAPPIVGEEN